MDKRIFAAVLSLALGASRADRGRAANPDSTFRKAQTVDLDLTLGLDEDPAPAPQGTPPPRHTWYFWAAAGAAITAGGVGLYWYEDQAKASGNSERNEQVFTDER